MTNYNLCSQTHKNRKINAATESHKFYTQQTNYININYDFKRHVVPYLAEADTFTSLLATDTDWCSTTLTPNLQLGSNCVQIWCANLHKQRQRNTGEEQQLHRMEQHTWNTLSPLHEIYGLHTYNQPVNERRPSNVSIKSVNFYRQTRNLHWEN